MLNDRDLHQFDLMDAVEEGVCFLTADHRIFFMNSQVEQLTGFNSSELLGRDFLTLFPDDQQTEIEKALQKSLAGEPVRLNARLIPAAQDRETPILLRLVRYTDPNSTEVGVYAMMLDLTDLVAALKAQESLKQRNRALEDMVVTCPLTGIYNRRYFELRFEEEVNRAHRYNHGMGLAIVDADNFKEINDTHGHQAGDEALKAIAQTLRDTVRATDVVARWGGDEFVLLLPEVKVEGILPLAIRLRQKIERLELPSPAGPFHVTTSIGLACILPHGEKVPASELFRQTDEALYKAKEGGRNRIVLHGHPIE